MSQDWQAEFPQRLNMAAPPLLNDVTASLPRFRHSPGSRIECDHCGGARPYAQNRTMTSPHTTPQDSTGANDHVIVPSATVQYVTA